MPTRDRAVLPPHDAVEANGVSEPPAGAAKPTALRSLHAATASSTFAIGAMLIWLCRDHAPVQACAFALMAIGFLSLGISQFGGGREAAVAAKGAKAKTDAPSKIDRDLDAAIDRVCNAIRRHIGANNDYKRDLDAFNDELARFPPRAEVREIIVELMNSNFEMQSKVIRLSKDLQASQQQIVSLRSNISEVGKIALLDALTNVGNRRFFDETLVREIDRARTSGQGLCLAMADLDRFKAVNDRFGHVVGDHLLRLFGEMLRRRMEGKGVAARYGGEEFAILFPKLSTEEARRVVEGLRHEMETRTWLVGAKEEQLGVITASFGLARLLPEDVPESFVQRADAKLLEAKTRGRNRIVVDESDAPTPMTGRA